MDEDFGSGSAEASLTFPKQCSALRKNEHVVIKGQACKIVEMTTSKTGKHGHAKVHLTGIGIFDGKKYEDICPSTHNMNVPNVSRIEYQVTSIEEGMLSLMNNKGDIREDIRAPEPVDKSDKSFLSPDEVETFIFDGDGNQELFATVLKAMDQERVISYKKVAAK